MRPYYDEGGVTIYHGDCLEVLPQLNQIGLVFTSPPYNLADRGLFAIARRSNVNFKRSSGWRPDGLVRGYGAHDDAMPYEQYREWQHQVLTETWRTITDDGAIYYNHKPRVLDGLVRLPTELNPGLPLRQVIIWDRCQGGVNVTFTQYMPKVEWVLLFAKPAFRLIDKAASSSGDLWRVVAGGKNGSRQHPAPFPVDLPMRAIATTRPGTVLDPFMGSGSTLVAAKSAGRRAVGIEIEERYCEIAAKRLGQEVFTL